MYRFVTQPKSILKFTGIRLTAIVAIIIISFFPFSGLFAQMDLPNPPANFETIPAGSFVIPMDTINQALVPAGDAPFNLKAYGLINKFLQNGIPVKWAIRSGKAKDAIDFSASASRVFPTPLPTSMVNFIAGPFIVTDTTLPCGLSTSQIIQNFGDSVAVFQLQQSVSVDIRYTLVHRPKIAVFNNGGYQVLHVKILNAAGIPDYTLLSAAQISTLADCFTFASEPHADTFDISLPMINGIQQFVNNGGNFLGQCEAVFSYENRGFFHTTTGINITNKQMTHVYNNSDMAAAQIHGTVAENRFGSCQNWTLQNGSAWRSYYYPVIADASSDTVVFVAAHMIAPTSLGGNVFFLGSHDYGGSGGPGGPGGPWSNNVDLTNLEGINGLRYYLNAVLIPSYNSNAAWANAGPDISVNCGDSVALGCSHTGPASATFSWSPATGLSCTNCPNPVASPSVTTTYVVTAAMSCNATDTVTVFVNSAATLSVNSATICSGNNVTLTAIGGVSYSWSPATGLSATTGGSVSASPTATTVYTITGTNAAGCSGTTYSTVSVNTPLVPSVNSPTICNGDSVNLIAIGSVNYSWSPATGLNYTTGSNVTASPGLTTTYTVTATDANGCSSTASSSVTVNQLPTITFNSPDVCIGDTAVINVNGTPAGNVYSWSTGFSGNTLTILPQSSTTYTVTGTSVSGCIFSATVPVVVNQLPSITATDTSVCAGKPATIQAQGGLIYSWLSSSGQNYSGSTVTINPLALTTFTVTGVDSNGCENTAVSTITMRPLPLISAVSDTICIGETATILATGGQTYNWMPGNISFASISVTPATTTLYTVTGIDSVGCINTSTASVFVNPLPSVTALSTSACLGDSGTLVAQGASTYLWPASGTSGNTFSDSPALTTTYSVTGYSTDGCANIASATITIYQRPTVDFNVTGSGCTPVEAAFQNLSQTNNNISTYQWIFGDGTTSNLESPPPHVYELPGSYTVKLIVSIGECTAFLIKPSAVSVYRNPVAKFSLDKEITDMLLPQVELFNTSTGDSSRYWYFGDGETDFSGINNLIHTFKDTGTYSVCLKVANSYGCADSICNDVTIKPVWSFFIPNAFTPNNDEVNDDFIGKSENVIEHEMWIYDRWGELLYYSGITNNPETAKPWNGKPSGKNTPVQNDVYVWVVNIKDIDGKAHQLFGHVTVVK